MSRQRYEKEIEDILKKASAGPAEPPQQDSDRAHLVSRRGRRGAPSPGREPAARHFGLKYQYALIAGIVLIVLGAVMNWLYFFLAGLVLVVAGYVIYYRAPRGGSGQQRTQKMWRGRSIDPGDPTDGGRRR